MLNLLVVRVGQYTLRPLAVLCFLVEYRDLFVHPEEEINQGLAVLLHKERCFSHRNQLLLPHRITQIVVEPNVVNLYIYVHLQLVPLSIQNPPRLHCCLCLVNGVPYQWQVQWL